MKPGQIVKYTHWNEDTLLTPKMKYGIVIKPPNEVGKILVAFGNQKMWVWCGDLDLVRDERNRSK